MRRGFTLLEMLLAFIILATIISLGVPLYRRAAERTKAGGAIANLRLIRYGELLYFKENRTYVNCSDRSTINSTLGLDIKPDQFTYQVSGATTSGFTATAARSSGVYQNQTISIDQDGDFSGTSPFVP